MEDRREGQRILRPHVDVVVPFAGTHADLVGLLDRLGRLCLAPRDTITVVDNRPPEVPNLMEDPRVIRASGLQTPAFARNAGARRGSAEWIVFFDADVEPAPDLLDNYFVTGAPADDLALLAGAIHDQEPPAAARHSAAARWMFLRKAMAQTTSRPMLGPIYKSANLAVRRAAFEAIGGFRENWRAGEDADLCYRLGNAGWRAERRDEAIVGHIGRGSVRALLAQQLTHGAGTQALDREYPGFSPPFTWRSLVASLIRGIPKAAYWRLRRDRDRALLSILNPATALAFHLGRLRSNERR